MPTIYTSVIGASDALFIGGTNGRIYKSTDSGSTFILQTTPNTTNIEGMAFNGTGFVAVGGNNIWRGNLDGTVWTSVSDTGYSYNTVASGGGVWIIAGDSNALKTSTDGTTWTAREPSMSTDASHYVFYASGYFVLVGANGQVRISTTLGVSWEIVSSPVSTALRGGCVAENNRLFICGDAGELYYSDDSGGSWSSVDSKFGSSIIYSISYNYGVITAFGEGGKVSYSVDNGETWTLESSSPFTATVYTSVNGIGINALYELADPVLPWGTTTGVNRANGGWYVNGEFHTMNEGYVYKFTVDGVYAGTVTYADYFDTTAPSYLSTSYVISINHDLYRNVINFVYNRGGDFNRWYEYDLGTGVWTTKSNPPAISSTEDLLAVASDPETGWYAVTAANDLYIFDGDFNLQQTFLNIQSGFVVDIGFYKARDGSYDYFGWNYGGDGGNHWVDRLTMYGGTLTDLVGTDPIATSIDAANNGGLLKLYPGGAVDYSTRRLCSFVNTSNPTAYIWSMEDTFEVKDAYILTYSLTTTESSSAEGAKVMLDVSGNTRTYDKTQPWRSIGAQGEYDQRVIWRRLGQHRSFTPRIRISSPVKKAVYAAYADIEPCR